MQLNVLVCYFVTWVTIFTALTCDVSGQFESDASGSTDFNPNANYEIYFSKRFGSPNDRPPRAKLERRCRESILHGVALLPFDAKQPTHYVKVAQIWDECATEESLPALRTALKACRWIETTGYTSLEPRSNRTGVHWHRLWKVLTNTWVKVSKKEMGEKQFNERLGDALTRNGPQLEPYRLADSIVAAGLEVRDQVYARLLKKRYALRSDLRMPIRHVIWYGVTNPEDPKAWIFRPTKAELKAMLGSGKRLTVTAAKDFAVFFEPTYMPARKAIVKDLRSDQYFRIARGIELMFNLATIPNGLDEELKAKAFRKLDKRIRELQALHDRGATVDIDSERIKIGDLEGYKRLRIPMLIAKILRLANPNDPGEDPVVEAHLSAFKDYVEWLETGLENLPDNVPRGSLASSINTWHRFFDNRGDGKGGGSNPVRHGD